MPAILNRVLSIRRISLLVLAAAITFYLFRAIGGGGRSTSKPGRTSPHRSFSFWLSGDEEEEATPRSRVTEELQEILKWQTPKKVTNHYPPYPDYADRDYDPNRWEAFRLNYNYYTNGSVNQIAIQPALSKPYNPYPSYLSLDYTRQWRGHYLPCDGHDGSPLNTDTVKATHAYDGVPEGFPVPDSGSYDAVGLDSSVCFDRFSRLGSYGMSDETREYYHGVKWMDLQNRCVQRNQDRFANPALPDVGPKVQAKMKRSPQAKTPKRDESDTSGAKYKARSAVLIRTWDTYEYQENDIQVIRSLITELNLLSGGEYHVFLFVNIKDTSSPLFTDKETYDALLEQYVPEEFRDIAVLWTEAVCRSWYPEVGEWTVYYQQWMPLQYFSKTHPEFEFVWNWEMDARYIGSHYHFLEQVAKYSRNQPRKYMWERNARFYFPAAHGPFEKFTADTNRIIRDSPWVAPVWGPQSWHRNQTCFGPKPPHDEDEDDFEWGVDEEADFISLLPIWDPVQTLWSYRNKLWGYPPSGYYEHDGESIPKYETIPRRTFINTLARLSKTLLDAMHHENTAGFGMASEMWPASMALQHGLKGVYVPHPIWFAHYWPAQYTEDVFNADGWGAGSLPGLGGDDFLMSGRGRAYDPNREAQNLPQTGSGPNHEGAIGRWSQERDNAYSPDREHNFGSWSWYFWSDFPKVLYGRWLGWSSGYGDFTGQDERTADTMRSIEWEKWETENGRLCYPAMLLHPVKNVHQPIYNEKKDNGGKKGFLWWD